MSDENSGCIFFFMLQFITYLMSIGRWFTTDHYAFWDGFKELVWALTPVLNFLYVGDWWLNIILFPVALVMLAFN